MLRHLIPVLIGLSGMIIYIRNLIGLEREKESLDNPLYVSARRREIYLWLVIFFVIMVDHIGPLVQLLFH
ncbi:hypothetical protein [uncultured Porphyromonas sp.]|uniref:hypothetical protein n=2 Tax=Porphyromonas TaxID=836 RepID=UPI00046AB41C|nr:hypothetical protein [uncultured Porphyromonas sp.]